jgi:hypothetical protein
MQVIIRKVGDTIRPSRLIPRVIKSQIEKMVFNFTAPQIKEHVLLHRKLGGSPVFCIVHWNAPDFLLLTVSQIEFLYPNSKIYVLDNGSQQPNIDAIEKGLERFNNITLFVAPNWATRIGADRLLYSHTKGLQFLLNYAAKQRDEIVVFLDQDCMLSANIDDLFTKLGRNVILIGPRYGGRYNLVHASFMILQPKRINQFFGKFSFFHEHTNGPEPYHGLSFKAKGKILFLDSKSHNKIPSLSSYSIQGGTPFAWHACYSSRTVGLSAKTLVDGAYPVSYLQEVRKLSFEYMKQIHKETIDRGLTIGNK